MLFQNEGRKRSMFCKNCGAELTPTGKFCVKCGTPVGQVSSQQQPQQAWDAKQTMGAQQNVGAQQQAWTGQQPQQTWAGQQQQQAWAGQQQQQGWAGQQNMGAQPNQYGYQPNYYAGPAVKEKKPMSKRAKRLIIGGGCTLAACLAVVLTVIFAGAQLKNFWRSTFSSPDSYYHAVEKESLGVTEKALVNLYDAYISPLSGKGNGTAATMRFELSDAGKSMLSSFLSMSGGFSVSGFDSFEIRSAAGTIDGDKVAIDMDVRLNDEDLVKAKLSSNLSTGETYLQIPSQSSSYLDLTSLVKDGLLSEYSYSKTNISEMLRLVREGLPSAEELEQLIKRYTDILLDSIKNVEKSKETITVKGVSQSVTVLDAKVSGQDLVTMLDKFVNALEYDETAKRVYEKLAQYRGGGAPGYDEVIRMLRSEVERIGSLSNSSDGFLELKDYVSSGGDIVGRTIQYNGGYANLGFEYMMPMGDGKFAIEMSVFEGQNKQTIFEGDGTTSGGMLNGVITINNNIADDIGGFGHFGYGTSIPSNFRISNFDINALRKGEIDGTVTFDLPITGSPLGALSIALDIKAGGDSASINCKLLVSGSELGNISFSFDKATCPSPIQPGSGDRIYDASNSSDVTAFAAELNLTELMRRITELTGINVGSNLIPGLVA